jgi:hypothetical protein
MFNMGSMDSSIIAALIKYFNIASITVLALFAVFGAIVIFSGKSRINIIRNRALLSAFCAAALIAFALEATVFNFQPYLKLFAGPEIEITDPSPEDPGVVLTTADSVRAQILSEQDEKSNISVGLAFKDLNINISSVFVEIEFPGAETSETAVITWTDEQGTYNFEKKLIKGMPYDDHSPLQPCGKVSELKVMFAGTTADGSVNINRLVLNKKIPFYFSGLRLIVVSFLLFAAICLLIKEPRTKAAYCLFEYKFNPASRKQNVIYALSVILSVLFSYICINTSYTNAYMEYPVHRQYNKYLVDALANGRTWLDYGTPENLLKAERPYDNLYRMANGYEFDKDVMWDWAWYKGKFYCYFGVVPAVILYLPYKLITGEYLSNRAGVFLFTAIAIVLMASLWRFCVKKYMPNAGFAFFTLSFFTLFFASGLWAQIRFPRVYSIAKTSGLMFALAGILLLLKSTENEKVNRLKVFFACLCFALIAGCRPNMIFVSLLVPFVLWKYRSRKLLPFVVIPYLIAAVPLCAYNYVRFESIFEFGVKYNLTAYGVPADTLLNPIGKIIKTFSGFVSYLFSPYEYHLNFPFVKCSPPRGDSGVMLGLINNIGSNGGMVNFPIVFCLMYLLKNILNKKTGENGAPAPIVMLIVIAVVIIAVNSFIVGFNNGYTTDFASFIILPSLICAYQWSSLSGNRAGVVHILLVVSCLVGLFLCVSGLGTAAPYDPVLYRYLELSLGGFRYV